MIIQCFWALWTPSLSNSYDNHSQNALLCCRKRSLSYPVFRMCILRRPIFLQYSISMTNILSLSFLDSWESSSNCKCYAACKCTVGLLLRPSYTLEWRPQLRKVRVVHQLTFLWSSLLSTLNAGILGAILLLITTCLPSLWGQTSLEL